MATHSSVLAWKMPCRKEPGRLRFIAGCSIELSVLHCRESNMTEVTWHTAQCFLLFNILQFW